MLYWSWPEVSSSNLFKKFSAENLLFYPEEHIIYGEYAFEQWEPKLIESILSFFSPDNMRIDILSKSFDKKSRGNFFLC